MTTLQANMMSVQGDLKDFYILYLSFLGSYNFDRIF